MKKFKSLVLTVIGLLCSLSVSAEDFEVDGIYYNITSSTAVEVTYCGNFASDFDVYSGAVTIPELVTYNGNTYNVTSIGLYAFFNCSGLTSVEIPNSVTSIGEYAFNYCYGLTSLVVAPDNPIYDSREGCNAIVKTSSNELLFGCQFTIIPNSVTSIGYAAFQGCLGLTSVEIPNSVTSIEGEAFLNCSSLTSVVIPNSVTSIGVSAFSGCYGLTSLVVAPDNPIYDSREGCNAIVKTSSNELLFGCQSTIIPNSVTSIGNKAFVDCYRLTSIEIPNSVTSIGNYAFSGCSDLTSVVIGNSMTSIGEYAFLNCSSLIKLSCYAKVPPTCGSDVFYGINKETCVLQVPESSLTAYQQADQWKEFFFIEDVLSGIGEVTMGGAVPGMVDVYSTNGMLIKRNAELKNLKHELPAGIYIIGGKKVLVK